ncbi:hypothetical protein C8F04DRAFT_1180708 [Mycena alexandri]|uniref:Uncharacterized protein n=1 Tax=Mycena alexandri TaxID=1745969 RepID=A0AAD6T0W6_9AGAR|nr:hypothetical protein C8F04DRAFT_1180708 [Mycena alexandri]
MNPDDNSQSLAGSTVKKIKGSHGGARKGSGRKPKAVKSQILGTASSSSMRTSPPPRRPASQVQSASSRAPIAPIFRSFNTHRPVPLANPIRVQPVANPSFWSGNVRPPGEVPLIHIMYSNGSTVSKHVRRQSCSPQ